MKLVVRLLLCYASVNSSTKKSAHTHKTTIGGTTITRSYSCVACSCNSTAPMAAQFFGQVLCFVSSSGVINKTASIFENKLRSALLPRAAPSINGHS